MRRDPTTPLTAAPGCCLVRVSDAPGRSDRRRHRDRKVLGMSEWNAMTYEGKDTILRVVRDEAERFFALAEDPGVWERPTPCEGWTTRDIVGHIVDTTEGYFAAFDVARGGGQAPAAHGLPAMSALANQGALRFRNVGQAELVERLRTDFHKMMEILDPLGPMYA